MKIIHPRCMKNDILSTFLLITYIVINTDFKDYNVKINFCCLHGLSFIKVTYNFLIDFR